MSTAAALLALAGALLALVGSLGLLRLGTFYERVHPPTLGATLGMALILAGSALHFFADRGRFPVQEILIAVFMGVTTPVTYTILARAALHRDRGEATEPSE